MRGSGCVRRIGPLQVVLFQALKTFPELDFQLGTIPSPARSGQSLWPRTTPHCTAVLTLLRSHGKGQRDHSRSPAADASSLAGSWSSQLPGPSCLALSSCCRHQVLFLLWKELSISNVASSKTSVLHTKLTSLSWPRELPGRQEVPRGCAAWQHWAEPWSYWMVPYISPLPRLFPGADLLPTLQCDAGTPPGPGCHLQDLGPSADCKCGCCLEFT